MDEDKKLSTILSRLRDNYTLDELMDLIDFKMNLSKEAEFLIRQSA